MLLGSANLFVSGMASRDTKDVALSQVHLEPDGTTVASNGRAIMAVEGVDRETIHWPAMSEAEPPEEGVGLPLSVVGQALKNMPADKRTSLQNAALTRCDNLVELTTLDMEKEQSVTGRSVSARYPEWRGVLQDAGRKAKQARVCISRRDMMGILSSMDKACEGGSDSPVFIELGGEKDGVVLRGLNYATSQHVVGMIAPLDVEGKWPALGLWERAVLFSGGKARRERRK